VIFWVWLAVPAVVHASGGCKSTVTQTAPDSRYTDNNDGTVTDLITGLMWKQCSEGQSTASTSCDTGLAATYTWQLALQQAETINSGGGFASYTDWRLPNRNELLSLVEFKCHSPAINTTFFPNTSSIGGTAQYWFGLRRLISTIRVARGGSFSLKALSPRTRRVISAMPASCAVVSDGIHVRQIVTL